MLGKASRWQGIAWRTWLGGGKQFSRFALLHSGLRQRGGVWRRGFVGRAEALPCRGCGCPQGFAAMFGLVAYSSAKTRMNGVPSCVWMELP